MRITVYTKSACVQCTATKRKLSELGHAFDLVDVEADPDAADRLRSAGYTQMPVVEAIVDSVRETWTGYRPDKIEALPAVGS